MPKTISLVAGFVPAILLSAVLWPLLSRFLKRRCPAVNYKGKNLINCAGLLIPLAFVGGPVVLAFLGHSSVTALNPVVVMLLVAAFFGFIDDLFGSAASKGFRGHFTNLLKGKVTTGALKAIGIGLISLLVAVVWSSPPFAILDALIIALFVNLMNLLDMRPGRALKVFIVLDVLMMLALPPVMAAGAAAALAPALFLLPFDLKEKVMLGDVGSNALGAVIGGAFVFNFSWSFGAALVSKIAVFSVLLAVQIFAERYSITTSVERIKVLRRLDELGRVRQESRES